jgi:hypothetical protein
VPLKIARDAPLGEVEHPGGEVARVDDLQRARRVAGRRDVAARAIRRTHHGSRKTPSCGPDDQPGAHDRDRGPAAPPRPRARSGPCPGPYSDGPPPAQSGESSSTTSAGQPG